MSSKVASFGKTLGAPSWLPDNVHLEVVMGSTAYGVAEDDSDWDVYGIAIPPKSYVFPHLGGEIEGFGTPGPRFGVWQKHHVRADDREYDFSIYGIVKFFDLAMTNNPNMVDAIFVPQNCVLSCTRIGRMILDARRLFLHRGAFHKFRGYAHAQLHKMRGDRERPEGKRRDMVDRFGYDVKFAYHLVRLLDECEQILESGDLVLGRNREILKEIRRGEWTEARVREHMAEREAALTLLYATSPLPNRPDEVAIKSLLLQCLEEHYGDLSSAVSRDDEMVNALRRVAAIIDPLRMRL